MSSTTSTQTSARNLSALKRGLFASRRLFGKISNQEKQPTDRITQPQSNLCSSFQSLEEDEPFALRSLSTGWEVCGDTEDELFFIFPDRPRPLESSLDETDEEVWVSNEVREPVPQMTNRNQCTRTSHKQIPRMNPIGLIKDKISTERRLMRCQNVWCVPNLSRQTTENLLKHAEPGNFILRVSHRQHAMVLSRRVKTSKPVNGIQGPLVEHNMIEVIPRSGYCLSSDRQAQLIFCSLTQLLDFYIRVSRSRTNATPFLRLPRAILDAQTLGDLEQINKRGVEFWSTLVDQRQAPSHELIGPNKVNHVTNDRRKETEITSAARTRPSSVDRWASHDNSARLAGNNPRDDVSRQGSNREDGGHRSRFVHGTDPRRYPGRERASSVQGSRYLLEPDDSAGAHCTPTIRTVQSIEPTNKNGIASRDCIASKAWDQLRPRTSVNGHQSDSLRIAELSGKPLINSRNRTAQTGIYEGSESELWRTMKRNSLEKLSIRKPSGAGNDHKTGSGPILKPWLNVQTKSQSQISSQEKFHSGVSNHRTTTTRPTNGLLSRTLDEHLRSSSARLCGSNKSTAVYSLNSTPPQTSLTPDDDSSSQLETTTSTDLHNSNLITATTAPSISSQSVEWPINDYNSDESDKLFRGNSMALNSENRPENNKLDSKSSSRTQNRSTTKAAQLIKLPAPKTVGRVFVMEAATYSNDDYELLCEAASRPGWLMATENNKNTRPEVCQEWPAYSHRDHSNGSSSVNSDCPKLRRALTTRNPERPSISSSQSSSGAQEMEDIEPRRRHGIFLEDLVSWRTDKLNNARNMIDKKENEATMLSSNQTEQNNRNSEAGDRPCGTHIVQNHRSATLGKDPVPRLVTSAAALKNPATDTAQPRSESEANENNTEKPNLADRKPDSTMTPVLTLLAAPRTSLADSRSPLIDWDPPPPPPGPPPLPPVSTSEPVSRSDGDTDAGSGERQQLDNRNNPSPSQSSRASTVFCPPWDTAPLGLYLSDLINFDKTIPGSAPAAGQSNRSSLRDSALRRRTLSTFEHRVWSERLSALASGGNSSPANPTEVQNLLHCLFNWEDKKSDTKETSTHDGSNTPVDEVSPPPIPQRRRRTRGQKMSLTMPGVLDEICNRPKLLDLEPYAVVACPPNLQRSRGGPPSTQQQFNQFETTEPFAVYDEAFMGHEACSVGLDDTTCIPLSLLEASHGAAKPVVSENATNSEQQQSSANYVYAQVVPHHLRRRGCPEAPPSVNAIDSDDLGSVSDRIAHFQSKPIMTVRGTGTRHRTDSDRSQTVQTVGARLSSAMLTSSSSSTSSGESDCCPGPSCPVLPEHHDHNHHHRYACGVVSSSSDHHSRSRHIPGRHIRHFVNRLLKDKSGKVAEQVNLFLECTREGSDRGPYEIMQSIRQFINGMTNYLLRNPELGLPAAVELEKEELSDFGFLNVGAMVESSLQKHVLRPLYRHVIKLLKQEQIKHNELDPIRTHVQWACSTSATNLISNDLGRDVSNCTYDALVEQVSQLFRRMERTYSVGCKMHYLMEIFHAIRAVWNPSSDEQTSSDHAKTTSEDFEPLCSWVFARAGLLLTPLVAEPLNDTLNKHQQHQPLSWAHRQTTVFCPAALQADYLQGLLHKTQLRSQAYRPLNDLFSMLYWVWSCSPMMDHTLNGELSLPNGSQPELDVSDTLCSDLSQALDHSQGVMPIPIELNTGDGQRAGRVSDTENPDLSETDTCSVPSDRFFGSTKRRIIPPRRRKTISGLQVTKPWTGLGGSTESQQISPVNASKFSGAFKSNTLSHNLTMSPSHLRVSHDALSATPNPLVCLQWRPWAPQTNFPGASPKDAYLHDSQSHSHYHGVLPLNQQIRVLVMDESSNQLQSQFYPLRPTLTVTELSNLIAFKMKIFDPKEFTLFAYVEGKEIPLDDSFSLTDFIDNTTTMDTYGSRSATGTLSSMRDSYTQSKSHQLGKANQFTSQLNSRSCSPTNPVNASHSQQKSGMRRGSRGTQSTHVPWWVLCKKLPTASMITDGLETEVVGPAPSAIDLARTAVSCGSNKPLLIFRRTNGYFAISARLLQSLGDHPLETKSNVH